jgi:hypothetical protein
MSLFEDERRSVNPKRRDPEHGPGESTSPSDLLGAFLLLIHVT